jgi:hypothetical protein
VGAAPSCRTLALDAHDAHADDDRRRSSVDEIVRNLSLRERQNDENENENDEEENDSESCRSD